MRGDIPPLPHTPSRRGAQSNTGYVLMALYLVKHTDCFSVISVQANEPLLVINLLPA